ncbi:N-methylhydantoinase B [Dissulfuribacter thermophilus]|uniref:N-methylhydantoinase B n=1 Tax=Dissulfuribacter thermophilus TaxID=1156395 RepID=A0A1B9F761_9BACT|nr:hydantoinase B/oxoprolinase family protein [Dissulfuribacter thermophilus]OCC15723.1 N-methylhydantoinase B [Dissulfuribacter thermophilus]
MPTPIDIEIINKSFCSIAEEMGIVLERAAYSPNIKERRDFSCAIFDANGNLIAQAAHIPVHLGAMPDTVKEVTKAFKLRPGDVIITNDPYSGGTHLPDITLIKGVFIGKSDSPSYYLVSRAHHADVGGVTPGSMPLENSIHREGELIRPTYLYKEDELMLDFLYPFLSQVRNPKEREGDLRAQVAALRRGDMRIKELLQRYCSDFLEACIEELLNYGERVTRSVIGAIPNGTYSFEDFLDDDGLDKQAIKIVVDLTIKEDALIADFSRSNPSVGTGLNTVKSVTRSCVYYCVFCLIGEGYPVNSGALRPIQVITRPGTIVDAQYPSPVAAGNVETSQRIVDVMFGALAKACPNKIPAASAGTMNNLAIGGIDQWGNEYAYYETIGGGMGARPTLDGLSGIQTHMTNTLNTPIEALEQQYPFLVEEYALRADSGGRGRYRGGDGIIRRIKFLKPAHVSILSERRTIPPYGLFGGEPGRCGINRIKKNGQIKWKILPGKCHVEVNEGDCIEIRTPGGGGYGEGPK